MTEQPATSRVDGIGGWPAVLGRIVAGEGLNRPEAKAVMGDILSGITSEVHIAGLLTALATKGESTDEMVGFVEAM